MSVLNQSGEEQVECPLCMEPLEVDDLHFYPCTCGYQICRFCWNRIREGENGLCPACRKAYPENPADFTPLSQEQVAAIKTEKKAREQKRRNKTLESRRALANVRVVQNNLVFVVGLPVRLADPEILKRQEYFGKYGKIHKVVINQSTAYAGSQGPSASAYVTYVTSADALRAIQGVNNVTLDGRVLKGSLGTTKYCANFMKNQPCPKSDCMYLHELGDPNASFTKEEMHAGLHQVYERRLHNQLLQAQRDKPDDKNCTGNPSNTTPTPLVTSSNINIVTTSKSKKETANGNGNGKEYGSNGNSKEAWPSLGSSPPADSPARKQTSPKPQHSTGKSQENGTSESSSPTQQQIQQSHTKNNKENHTETKTNRSHKEITNGQSKKSKSEKSKQKNNSSNSNSSSNSTSNSTSSSNSISQEVTEEAAESTPVYNTTENHSSVFESDTQQSYLTNELDELESDRHSLLENHDLLDNSDHSLLDDDNTHNLLNDANNVVVMMQTHREMLAGLVDNNHILAHNMKSPLTNGYGLLDREPVNYLGNERQISQINHGIMDQNELMLHEQRSHNEMLMRNEMLARQHNAMVEQKHYMPTSSIGLETASELLGANFHQNHNMLPPFGMRVDSSMGSGNSISANSLSSNSVPGSSLNAMGGYMLQHQQMLQQNQTPMPQNNLVNGFDAPQSGSEGRYLAENMDKFFTDFHKAQQMRQMLSRDTDERRYAHAHEPRPLHSAPHYPHNMLSAERLEMEHKQRMSTIRAASGENCGGRAAGDGDDDLDFDPFKETQKALAEMMETEMMFNTISSGDNMERVHRARIAPPPGFGHLNAFGMGVPPHHQQHQGYNSNSAQNVFSDWTQMDPAIMSTSVSFGKQPHAQSHSQPHAQPHAQSHAQPHSQPGLTPQQQELFARFNQLNVQPNGISKHQMSGAVSAAQQWGGGKLWGAYSMPIPPGFAPPPASQHPAECIDAK
ncbi:CCR4-NOT transcription complex subunit 4 [Papilio xuthus]|uniref:CCR4-NOT transcription complex subunit 4 n=1 Tax=Papilio xuthus TaxID=66420 RepID=A0A0N0PAE7_PAPXU|nr:CCR4-NOT transcription complex subunit 4 [Papilio xuthus]